MYTILYWVKYHDISVKNNNGGNEATHMPTYTSTFHRFLAELRISKYT